MKCRFRVEHKNKGRKTVTVTCTNPANVIKILARYGWIVQNFYEVD
jgi:hypothetical protein